MEEYVTLGGCQLYPSSTLKQLITEPRQLSCLATNYCVYIAVSFLNTRQASCCKQPSIYKTTQLLCFCCWDIMLKLYAILCSVFELNVFKPWNIVVLCFETMYEIVSFCLVFVSVLNAIKVLDIFIYLFFFLWNVLLLEY